MFLWIDSKLLSLTEKLVKALNWLTGKDNFWYARKVAVYGCILSIFLAFLCVVISSLDMGVLPAIFFASPMMCIALISSRFEFLRALSVEKIKCEEQHAGAKQLWLEIALKDLRHISLSGLVELLMVYTVLNYFFLAVSERPLLLTALIEAVFLLIFIFELIVRYLISVEKPPYAKSQVGAWLKSLVTIPKLMPVRMDS